MFNFHVLFSIEGLISKRILRDDMWRGGKVVKVSVS